jgi:hypothetical protein
MFSPPSLLLSVTYPKEKMKEKDFFLNKLGTPMVRKQQYPVWYGSIFGVPMLHIYQYQEINLTEKE